MAALKRRGAPGPARGEKRWLVRVGDDSHGEVKTGDGGGDLPA
jgi:hypothetical protein